MSKYLLYVTKYHTMGSRDCQTAEKAPDISPGLCFLFHVGIGNRCYDGFSLPVHQHAQAAGVAAAGEQVVHTGLTVHIDGHVVFRQAAVIHNGLDKTILFNCHS